MVSTPFEHLCTNHHGNHLLSGKQGLDHHLPASSQVPHHQCCLRVLVAKTPSFFWVFVERPQCSSRVSSWKPRVYLEFPSRQTNVPRDFSSRKTRVSLGFSPRKNNVSREFRRGSPEFLLGFSPETRMFLAISRRKIPMVSRESSSREARVPCESSPRKTNVRREFSSQKPEILFGSRRGKPMFLESSR